MVRSIAIGMWKSVLIDRNGFGAGGRANNNSELANLQSVHVRHVAGGDERAQAQTDQHQTLQEGTR